MSAKQPSNTAAPFSQVVEAAARATGCLAGVLYLCVKDRYEVVASFGCRPSDAVAEPGLRILDMAKRNPEGLTVLSDAQLQHGFPSAPWLFAATGPARFVAVAHVAYGPLPACGLLLVADRALRPGLSLVQRYMLRANAARITEMLESHAQAAQPKADIFAEPAKTLAPDQGEATIVTTPEPIGPELPKILSCNALFARLTGYGATELPGLSLDALLCIRGNRDDDLKKLRNALWDRETVLVELVFQKKDGTEFLADIRVVPETDQEGDCARWFVAPREKSNPRIIAEYRQQARLAEAENQMLEHEKAALEAEIQERRRVEARLHYLAFHDALTSLYNRQFFIDRLAAAFERLTVDLDFRFAVLLLDLDRFKLVNDSFGHRAGDLMLIEIAERLSNCTRAHDVVARLGGDEFAILIEGFDKPGYVAAMAERMVEVVRFPVQLGGQEVFPSASIGAAYETKFYRAPEEILRDADIAMYEAKRRHKGFLMFDESMHRGAVTSSQLRTELQSAVARSEFYVEYQPIFQMTTREVKGVEALVRWQHPTRGKLLPAEFISVAEEMGLIRKIGSTVLREACRQMREWQNNFPHLRLRLSVNISGHELTDIRFIPQLDEILTDTGIAPASLQLEVTESVLFPTSEPIVALLANAKALGVRFALDDFGTGYSSLGYLDRYPIDAIKIDQSFVAGIPERQRTMSIVKAIIDLAAALNLEVTAEGIEQDTQMQALLAMGCAQAQGFLLSKPLSGAAMSKLLTGKQRGGRKHAAI
jgi:diguanylate cyclase (GGDEF)-like protein/PAS domain S-box-containing protein